MAKIGGRNIDDKCFLVSQVCTLEPVERCDKVRNATKLKKKKKQLEGPDYMQTYNDNISRWLGSSAKMFHHKNARWSRLKFASRCRLLFWMQIRMQIEYFVDCVEWMMHRII